MKTIRERAIQASYKLLGSHALMEELRVRGRSPEQTLGDRQAGLQRFSWRTPELECGILGMRAK